MKTANYIFPLFLLLCISSCSKVQDGSFYFIDVNQSYPNLKLNLTDIADITYLKLESDSNFLVSTRPLCISEKYVVTNGEQEGDILLFDNRGNPVNRFSHHGNGPHEYLYTSNVYVDDISNEVFIHDSFKNKIFVYKTNGDFVREFSSDAIIYIYPYNENSFLCYSIDTNSTKSPKQPYFSFIVKSDGSVLNTFTYKMGNQHDLAVRKKTNDGTFTYTAMHLPIIKTTDGYILNELSSDTIYKYSFDGTLSPFIARTPSLASMSTPVYLQFGLETREYIFMMSAQINENNIDNMFPSTNLVYDKGRNQLYQYTIMNEDFTDYNIVLEAEVIDHVDRAGYGVIRLRNSNLIEARDKGKLHGKLKEIATTLDEEGNDILMLLKFK